MSKLWEPFDPSKYALITEMDDVDMSNEDNQKDVVENEIDQNGQPYQTYDLSNVRHPRSNNKDFHQVPVGKSFKVHKQSIRLPSLRTKISRIKKQTEKEFVIDTWSDKEFYIVVRRK